MTGPRYSSAAALSIVRGSVSSDSGRLSAWLYGKRSQGERVLADCFAVALAASVEAELLTGNPEITDWAALLPCGVMDLR